MLNSDVSFVVRLVAVAVTNSPAASVAVNRPSSAAWPPASVVTVVVAQIPLAFAVAGGIGRGAAEEFDAERGAGGAVQRALHADLPAARGGPGQHGVILQSVRARIAIAAVVRGHAVDPQVDPQAGVAVDRIAGKRVAGTARDGHTCAAVEREGIAFSRRRAAHRVIGTAGDVEAVEGVAQVDDTAGVGPQEIALDDVAAPAGEHHAVETVAADDVARPRAETAQAVVVAVHPDAALRIAQHGSAGRVDADVVAFDGILRRTRQIDPVAVIAGDDVAFQGREAAQRVAAGAVHVNPRRGRIEPVGPAERAGHIGADVVPLNRIAAVRGEVDSVSTGAGEPVDHQPLHRTVAGRDAQAGDGPGQRAVQFDDRGARETGLREAVDHDRVGDRGQSGCELDRVMPTAADVELDAVGQQDVGVLLAARMASRSEIRPSAPRLATRAANEAVLPSATSLAVSTTIALPPNLATKASPMPSYTWS